MVTAVFAQENPLPYDFVVIVDNSISMGERKGMVVSAVREVVNCGFARQIQAGDRLHLWTGEPRLANEDPAPIVEWDPEDVVYTASKCVEQVRSSKFQRGTYLGPRLSDLAALVPQTKVLMAVIYTDGEEPLSGLAFANEINRDLPKLRREASRLKRPIQIALAAREGKWTDWRVSVGADPRFLCRLPQHPKPEPPPSVEVVAAPAAVPNVEEKSPEPEMPVSPFLYPPGAKVVAAASEALPQVSTPPIPEVSPQAVQVQVAPSETVVTNTLPPVAAVVQPVPVAPAQNKTAEPESKGVPDPIPAAVAVAIAPIELPLTVTPPLTPVVAPTPAPAQLQATGFPYPVVFAGTGGILSLGLAFLLLYRSRPPARRTFISQSLVK